MHIRYGIFLTIKLLISRHVFLHGGGSSRLSSLFLYLCLFVVVYMVNKNSCSCSFVRKKTSKNIVKMLTSAAHNHVNSEPCLTCSLRMVMFVYRRKHAP